ncbi:Glucose-6-phosphate 1-dehydrogenase [Thelohanellus kitauei]|uniref:glucose-6-phosphate dehydrogenase (NADP(+)) n=1 Tax=Thelohanellus kitauei TaxID=669202 RepID=A0A0C2N4C2_THEKT|nr:Glucose-6-phosphate 1-dehydrogenase [Thelohanellus kitauei]
MEDVVVGQYIGNPDANPSIPVSKGYKDDKLVPPDSITPTFANIVMYINNDRWRALKEKSAEVRVQFKPISNGLFEKSAINELVIKMQPDELPGEGFNLHITELDLTYKDRHKDFQIHDAYVKLIMDIINGTQVHFVRSDEVEEAWKIFTPVLKNLEDSKIQPIPYVFGTYEFSEC